MNAEPACVGIECAPEGPARDMIAVLLDVIDEQALGDIITVRRVSYYRSPT